MHASVRVSLNEACMNGVGIGGIAASVEPEGTGAGVPSAAAGA